MLMAGADAVQAREPAERLRRAVEDTPLGGQRVTMSSGVSASRAGEPFVWDEVFAEADAALCAAKHAGRNRVGAAPATMAAA